MLYLETIYKLFARLIHLIFNLACGLHQNCKGLVLFKYSSIMSYITFIHNSCWEYPVCNHCMQPAISKPSHFIKSREGSWLDGILVVEATVRYWVRVIFGVIIGIVIGYFRTWGLRSMVYASRVNPWWDILILRIACCKTKKIQNTSNKSITITFYNT